MSVMLILLFVVAVDQSTKYLITANMMEGASIPLIKGIFHLTYILNSGAAFGILENSRWFFVAAAVGVLGALFYWRRHIRNEKPLIRFGSALFAGGALGNLIDRVRIGMVIDFFDFRVWPIFNVADIAICVGAGLIIWSMLMTEEQTTQN